MVLCTKNTLQVTIKTNLLADKHRTKSLTHQTGNYPVTCFVSRPSGITLVNIHKNSSGRARFACMWPRTRSQGRRSSTSSHAYQVSRSSSKQYRTWPATEAQNRTSAQSMAYRFSCGSPLLPADWTPGQAYGLDNRWHCSTCHHVQYVVGNCFNCFVIKRQNLVLVGRAILSLKMGCYVRPESSWFLPSTHFWSLDGQGMETSTMIYVSHSVVMVQSGVYVFTSVIGFCGMWGLLC